MTHDPLCPFTEAPGNWCQSCESIAEVRADEQEKLLAQFDRMLGGEGISIADIRTTLDKGETHV